MSLCELLFFCVREREREGVVWDNGHVYSWRGTARHGDIGSDWVACIGRRFSVCFSHTRTL